MNIELKKISLDRAKRIREFRGEISAYYDITGVSTLNGGPTKSLFESSFDNFVDRPPNRGVTLSFSYPIWGIWCNTTICWRPNGKLRILPCKHWMTLFRMGYSQGITICGLGESHSSTISIFRLLVFKKMIAFLLSTA